MKEFYRFPGMVRFTWCFSFSAWRFRRFRVILQQLFLQNEPKSIPTLQQRPYHLPIFKTLSYDSFDSHKKYNHLIKIKPILSFNIEGISQNKKRIIKIGSVVSESIRHYDRI